MPRHELSRVAVGAVGGEWQQSGMGELVLRFGGCESWEMAAPDVMRWCCADAGDDWPEEEAAGRQSLALAKPEPTSVE